jgi:hypothetical protein
MSALSDAIATVYYVIAIGSVIVVVGKLFYGWLRGDQISKRFIEDMASYHLPYIYKELRILNPGSHDHPTIAFSRFKDK